jgi:hypothetical protein
VRATAPIQRLRAAGPWRLAVRTAWLAVAVLGLVALMSDIGELA